MTSINNNSLINKCKIIKVIIKLNLLNKLILNIIMI